MNVRLKPDPHLYATLPLGDALRLKPDPQLHSAILIGDAVRLKPDPQAHILLCFQPEDSGSMTTDTHTNIGSAASG